jgi:epoxyqueuosine reductase
MSFDPQSLAIKQRARELGFDLVGITPATPSGYSQYLRHWLNAGSSGEMAYLATRIDERTNPATYFEGALSVICVGLNYFVPLQESPSDHGRIARYALGLDYHDLIKSRLHQLADWIRQLAPEAKTRCSVDTAPVMEKDLAARAGIGWIGKNTCSINEKIGSWILLGEVLTTLPLTPDEPAIDRCGSCRRCLDACPTQAITAPYQLDARRCISYLTIEHRGEIDEQLSSNFGDWIYGCDICQDVCPWNRNPPAATNPHLQPRWPTGSLDPERVLKWTDDDFKKELKGSAMKRVKLPMLKRNANIVLTNKKNNARAEHAGVKNETPSNNFSSNNF